MRLPHAFHDGEGLRAHDAHHVIRSLVSPGFDGQNRRVFVSADVIGMIIALFAFAVSVLGGVGGMLAHQSKRIDARFENVDARFEKVDAQFDRVDARFDKVDARFEKVEAEIADVRREVAGVKDELVEVKVAIARLEGPRPHLQRI
jgi:septal ring factor EnvC (AmiA/AmiB activator)